MTMSLKGWIINVTDKFLEYLKCVSHSAKRFPWVIPCHPAKQSLKLFLLLSPFYGWENRDMGGLNH